MTFFKIRVVLSHFLIKGSKHRPDAVLIEFLGFPAGGLEEILITNYRQYPEKSMKFV